MFRFSDVFLAAMLLTVSCLVMGCANSSGLDAATTTLQVTAVDGYLENARIWLDTIPNGRFDAEEPNGLTNAKGRVAITIPEPYVPRLSTFTLYALADADLTQDTGIAVPHDYLMSRPLPSGKTKAGNVFTVLNPFVTLAAAIANQNPEMDLDQALQEVADELHMEKSAIAGDYFKDEPEKTARKIEAVARKMAREILKTDETAAPFPEKEKITIFQRVSAEHTLVAVAKKTLAIKKEEAAKLLTRLGVTDYLAEVAIDEALSLNDQEGFDKEATKNALQTASLKLAAQDTDVAKKHLAPLRKMAGNQKLQYADYLQPEDFRAAIRLKENGDIDTEKTNTAIANLDTDGDGLTMAEEISGGTSPVSPSPLTIVLEKTDFQAVENSDFTITPALQNPCGTVVWTIHGDDAKQFSLNAQTGVLTFKKQDYEWATDSDLDGDYRVTLRAEDKKRRDSVSLTISVTDIFDELWGPETAEIDENKPFQTQYHTESPDPENVQWSLAGEDAALFSFQDGKLSLDPKDFEAPVDQNKDNTYIIRITAKKKGEALSKSLSLTVKDVAGVAAMAETWTRAHSKAGLREDGSVVVWGNRFEETIPEQITSQLTDIITIATTGSAFAALKQNGTVITWGDPRCGGDSGPVQSQLKDILFLAGNAYAFAALKKDGSVVTWGDKNAGGDSSSVQKTLKDVVSLVTHPNQDNFAALKKDGTVVTWGANYLVPDGIDPVAASLTGIVQVKASGNQFIAIDKDKKAVVWSYGARAPFPISGKLTDVVDVITGCDQIAVLKSNGDVESWRYNHTGLTDLTTGQKISDIIDITTNRSAFAGIKQDGTVVVWGKAESGGTMDSVKNESLTGIRKIFANPLHGTAFAALKEDGTVITWGNAKTGGDSSSVSQGLSHIKSIHANEGAFTAVKDDGSYFAWGEGFYGGYNQWPQNRIGEIVRITTGWASFIAVLKDGSARYWGGNWQFAIPFQLGQYGDKPLFYDNRDTDQDGLTNFEERETWHTSPGNWDTDGDGVSDQMEINNGTDPLKRNSLDANGNRYEGRPGAASTPDGWEDNNNDGKPDNWLR